MTSTSTPLPYGPVMTRLLPVLRRGFRGLNRLMVPAIDAGFGPRLATPAGGSILVLRTVGHRSGMPRRATRGFARIDLNCGPDWSNRRVRRP